MKIQNILASFRDFYPRASMRYKLLIIKNNCIAKNLVMQDFVGLVLISKNKASVATYLVKISCSACVHKFSIPACQRSSNAFFFIKDQK